MNATPDQPQPHTLPIDAIRVGARRRKLSSEAVARLADSIASIGLLNPITVRADGELVAGLHRLEACRSLGWLEVPVTVLEEPAPAPDATERERRLRAKLAEIDENLIRSELSTLEHAEHMAARKAIYEDLHPAAPTGRGGDRRSTETVSVDSFTAATAEALGVNARTVRQDVQIGTMPEGVRDALRDTPVADRKRDLLEIARMEPETRAAVVEAVVAGAPTVAAAVAQLRPERGAGVESAASAPLSLDDPAVQGHQAALEEGPWVDCDACGGSGLIDDRDDCDECGGDGGWHDRDTDDTDTDTDAERTSLDEGHDSAAPGASESGRAGSVPDPVAPTHTTTHAEGADAAQAAAAGADDSGAERPVAPTPAHKKGTIGYVQEHIVRQLGSVNARGLGKRIEIDTIRSWLKRDSGVILSDREFAQIVRMGRESGLWDTDAADNIWLPAPAKPEKPRPAALPPDDLPVPISEREGYDSDSWGTPAAIIEDARTVLGAIDLDPASNEAAQKVVRAAKHYTKADNGLARPWSGRVWLNPPFSYPLVAQFTERLIAEYDAGAVTAALLLVNNTTDTRWFHALLRRFPVCFTEGRLAFSQGDGTHPQARQGQAIFYLGPDVDRFREVFGKRGTVVGVRS